MGTYLDRLVSTVTGNSRRVVVAALLVTAVLGVGVFFLPTEEAPGVDYSDTDVAQKQAYIDEHYDAGREGSVDLGTVYVSDPDGNVLSKASLVESLRFQQSVVERESVSTALVDGLAIRGVGNAVARSASDETDPTLAEQISTLESLSQAEVRRIVRSLAANDSRFRTLLPSDYDADDASATSRRMVFRFGGDEASSDRARTALYEAANARGDGYFTVGEDAKAAQPKSALVDDLELIVPFALLLLLVVLSLTYRDVVDVVVGFGGVAVTLVWMFGILGWLQINPGRSVVVAPVLAVGLSIDYGLHIFMRYREQRGPDEAPAPAMRRAIRGVALALVLVTVTTAVGSLSNTLTQFARNLSFAITVGVLAALAVFLTFVPALKLELDGFLESRGIDRRKEPLGKTGYLRRFLTIGVGMARLAAPAVLVFALLGGAVGAMTWTNLDRQSTQVADDEPADWKRSIPAPIGIEVSEYEANRWYVEDQFRETDPRLSTSQVLIAGDVTHPEALERTRDGVRTVRTKGIAYGQSGEVTVVSPLSVIRQVAESDPAFNRTVTQADTNGNGIPDRNLKEVYDALFEAAPEKAATVIERTDDGQYRTMRIVVPVEQGATPAERTEAMRDVAQDVDNDGPELTATPVGRGVLLAAEGAQISQNTLKTLVLALAAVVGILVVVYRVNTGSAGLGAVTVIPIVLVALLVFVGMYAISIPLTVMTTLLLSLVVGLGIDYNIHVSDRFFQEFDEDTDVWGALEEAVTGTGGALLASTLTSASAFATLWLSTNPRIRSFGGLVVLALLLSFVVSIYVLPSALFLWARLTPGVDPYSTSNTVGEGVRGD